MDPSGGCESYGVLECRMFYNSKNTYFSEYLSPFTACSSLTLNACMVVTKVQYT